MTKKPNTPFNFNSGPKFNPGIKSDRGRLIAIIVGAAIVYWLYGLAQGIISEVFPPEAESTIEDGIDSIPDTSETYTDPIAEPDVETVPKNGTQIFNSTTINSDLSDEATLEILKETREDVIRQLKEQKQYEQIEIFEEALEEFEDSL